MPTPPRFDEFFLTDSARRHGCNDQDVADVFRGRTFMINSRRGELDTYETFGRNRAGAYLLVAARLIESDEGRTWRVFHVNRMTEAERRRDLRHIMS